MVNQLKTPNDLQNSVMPKIQQAVDYVVQKIWNENREIVRKIVYEAYQPTEYERTYEFKEAWDFDVKTLGNYVEGKFFYDPRLLTVNPEEGQHASVIDGSPMTEYLAEIIYQGMSGKIFGKGPWTRKRNAWNELVKVVGKQKLNNWMYEGLQLAGLKVKRHRTSIEVM